MQTVNPGRIRILNKGIPGKGPVVYWMSRDQRTTDNWALLFARQLADENGKDLLVVFTLSPAFQGAGLRHYSFMLKGLAEVEENLKKYRIPFLLLPGYPPESLKELKMETGISYLVTDFDPLRIKLSWKREVCESLDIPVSEVDAHNIVPCLRVSTKQEFGAYTIRPKIHRLLNEYLVEFPGIRSMKSSCLTAPETTWIKAEHVLENLQPVPEVNWILPGETKALEKMEDFITDRLPGYNAAKNDPNQDAVSDLSPYLHFGHLSAQRIALEILKRYPRDENSDAFLEELIVRRELSDNYCYFNPDYDNTRGFPAWAIKTLNEHRSDEREYLYSDEEFEQGKTHDPLWNAAQKQMLITGKMHGYMRMYWAKKILEWSRSPEEAMRISIYLNDKYELDGRDPNGYTGCAWSIGGVHDRAWNERSVFGKIRYMNYNGCKRKFDVNSYINKWGKENHG
jgi:deoxyribodipyrimidine photo-lyase